ncbi:MULTISPECIES: hypothetical protein [unclassified Streptomyces]|uniref:hypothetical protein n=1 Tax=unclassified Streptomyces TaxID=2593676 RepID=UPI0033A2F86B
MSELPPDPPRRRAILAHLNQQLTENETVVIYLRLQRDAVQAALTRTEQPSPLGPRRPGRPVKGGTGLPALAQADGRVGFVVQQKRTPQGPEPAMIHVSAGRPCTSGRANRTRPR